MSNSTPVAFVTCAEHSHLTADDRLAASALAHGDVRVDAVRWDSAGVNWSGYRAIVIRSTWDYHVRLPEFLGWIDRLEALDAPLWNPPEMVRWNTDKRYLTRFESGDLRPPASVFLARGSAVDLAATLEAHGWNRAVMKPTVSADGFSTESAAQPTAARDQSTLDGMLARGDVMLQELVPEIETHGELSLMFFCGEFSHAVSKRPRRGDFRVQERLGGVITAADAPAEAIDAARSLLTAHASNHLYARVDIVATPRRLVLMEMELVEPSLYLEHKPGSAAAFASAVRRVLPARRH